MIVKVYTEVELEVVKTESSTAIVNESVVENEDRSYWTPTNDARSIERIRMWIWSRVILDKPFFVGVRTPQAWLATTDNPVKTFDGLVGIDSVATKLHERMRLMCDISDSGSWLFTIVMREVETGLTFTQDMHYTSERSTWET